MTGMGAGLTWGSAFDRMDRRRNGMSRQKVALCFPGQGSLEAGHGPGDRSRRCPRRWRSTERAARPPGSISIRLCFETPRAELVETEIQQPALVATSLAVLAALRARGHRAGLRRRPLGRRVRRAGRRAGALGRGGDRARPRARPRDGRGRAGEPRLDGRDPRPRGRGGREALHADRRRVAGELQLPRPDRRLRRRTRPSTSAATRPSSQGARRAVKLRVSGAFHSPLVARAAERLRPAIEKVHFKEPIAPFMSTVTAKIEPAQRHGRAARRAADRAGAGSRRRRAS